MVIFAEKCYEQPKKWAKQMTSQDTQSICSYIKQADAKTFASFILLSVYSSNILVLIHRLSRPFIELPTDELIQVVTPNPCYHTPIHPISRSAFDLTTNSSSCLEANTHIGFWADKEVCRGQMHRRVGKINGLTVR